MRGRLTLIWTTLSYRDTSTFKSGAGGAIGRAEVRSPFENAMPATLPASGDAVIVTHRDGRRHGGRKQSSATSDRGTNDFAGDLSVIHDATRLPNPLRQEFSPQPTQYLWAGQNRPAVREAPSRRPNPTRGHWATSRKRP